MNAHTDTHAATTPGVWPPPATPAPDVVDYGTMNRELLAEKLASAYIGFDIKTVGVPLIDQHDGQQWLAVVDVAIAELQGTPNS